MSRIWIGNNLINFDKVIHISFEKDYEINENGDRKDIYNVIIYFVDEYLKKTCTMTYDRNDQDDGSITETTNYYDPKVMRFIISKGEYQSFRESM